MVFLFNGKSQGAKKGLGTWDDEEVIKKKKGKKSNMADLLFFLVFLLLYRSSISIEHVIRIKGNQRERVMVVKIYLLLYYNESNLVWQG
jgi:hypothetical protein